MCGRFTVKATWAELVALYQLTMEAPPHNLRPRYNVCPTDPVDVVTAKEGKRELVPMRWGLVPRLVEQDHRRPMLRHTVSLGAGHARHRVGTPSRTSISSAKTTFARSSICGW